MQHSLKDLIKEFLQSYNLEERVMAVRIKAVWEKLMGKTIAGHTLKIQLRNKKLFLHFDSPSLKEELSYSEQKVIQMINEEFGEEVVREIIY